MTTFDVLDRFRRNNPELLAKCCPLKRRFFTTEKRLANWLGSGVHEQALYRAQFLPLGPSAFIRRIVSPSPGRDCFLSANARGCFYRTWRIGGGRGPSFANTGRIRSLHLGTVNRPTRCVSVRVGRLESFFGSGRPTRITFQLGRPTRIIFRFVSADRPGSLLFRSARSV